MAYILLFAGILNIFLSCLVLYTKHKELSGKLFFIFSILSGYWVVNNFFTGIFPNLMLLRNGYAIAVFLVSATVVWILYFATNKFNKVLSIFIYSGGILFFIIAQFTDLILKDASNITFGGGVPAYGPLFSFFVLYILILLFFSLLKLFLSFIHSTGNRRLQLLYVFIGLSIYALISTMVSLILPLFGINKFIPLDSSSSIFFIGFTAYAILRYRFMDIRAIIFRSIAFGFIVLLISSIFAIISTLITKLFTDFAGIQSNMVAGLAVAILVTLFYQPARNVIEKVTNTFLYKKSYNSDLLLKKINEMTSSLLDLKTLNISICGLLEDAFNSEKIGIALLNEKKKLRIAYQKGFLAGVPEMLISFPGVTRIMLKQFQETPGIFVIDERKTQHDNGEFMPVSPKMMNLLHENDLALIIPLYSKENLIGVLALGNKKSGEAYSTRDLNILNIMSGQIAVAIDRAQLYGHLEELVEERTEELKSTNEKLEGANIQLKKLDESKSEFISIASHQLRSPLTAVKGYVSMMKEGDYGKIPPKQLRILDIVFTSNERLIALVNDLLNISRIESGKQKYNFQETDIVVLIDEIVTKLKPQADHKQMPVVFHKPEKVIPKVMIDSEKMHEVMMNFIDNAIKYTPKGQVDVFLKPEPQGMVTFSVKDTGMGITKENMPQLFKKFSRGEGSFLVHTEGTGLGLYVAKMNVDAHGGKIWAESEGEGKGATFLFSIPISGPKKLPEMKEINNEGK